MIVALHVATGGAAGYLAGSRAGALLLGLALHLAADRVPHDDIADRRFEVGSGLVCLAVLAARRGVRCGDRSCVVSLMAPPPLIVAMAVSPGAP